MPPLITDDANAGTMMAWIISRIPWTITMDEFNQQMKILTTIESRVIKD